VVVGVETETQTLPAEVEALVVSAQAVVYQ
jgi:hypothetical protein